MTEDQAKICWGEVVHKRLRPKEHKLRYSVFSLLLDVDRLGEIDSRLKLFRVNGFSLFSLQEKDHGFRDGSSLSDFAWSMVEKTGFKNRVATVKVLLYPRIIGFAFNPLTVYFCCDERGDPVLMIYEVRNTFGENLTYVLEAGPETNGAYCHSTPKQFYVSPFNKVEGDYTFHVRKSDKNLTVGVALKTDGNPLLRTHFSAATEVLTDSKLMRAFWAYPLMTLKVVAGIHWEALKLWRKGLGLQEQPATPEQPIVFGQSR